MIFKWWTFKGILRPILFALPKICVSILKFISWYNIISVASCKFNPAPLYFEFKNIAFISPFLKELNFSSIVLTLPLIWVDVLPFSSKTIVIELKDLSWSENIKNFSYWGIWDIFHSKTFRTKAEF